MMRKALKNFSTEVHFLVKAQVQICNIDKNELVHWYFSMILTTFIYNYLQNILGWLLPCAFSNPTKENFATRQHLIFIYIKHSIDRVKFIYILSSITKFTLMTL